MTSLSPTTQSDDRIANAVRKIAASALTLGERLALPSTARRPLSSALAAQLQAAQPLCALAQKLYAPPLEDTVNLFFDVCPDQLTTLPKWAATLAAILSFWGTTRVDARYCPEPDAMFANIFAPLLEFAQAGLSVESGEAQVIVHGARIWLQQRLLQLSGRTLATAFVRFRRETAPLPNRFPTFIDNLRNGGVISLLLHYPVLGRVWAHEIDNWQQTLKVLLRHFNEDRALLGRHFPGAALPLSSFEMGLSDPHEGGRTVCRAVFEGGLTLAYKPRPVAIEAAHAALLTWFNTALRTAGRPPLLAMRGMDVLDRGDHGWVAWVSHRSCSNEQEIANYYRRFGQLLALNQLLGIGDIHPENLVASGEFPVLVDVEVALRTPLVSQLAAAEDSGSRALLDSILFTGMVPAWVDNGKGAARDTSGWQKPEGLLSTQPQHRWRGAGTDDIALDIHQIPVEPTHLPLLDGHRVAPTERLSDLLEGLSSVYKVITDFQLNGKYLSSAITAHCADLPLRFVFRDTAVYSSLLERLTSPSCNSSGLMRSIEAAALAEAGARVRQQDMATMYELISAECASVESNDIPYFHCESSATWLSAAGKQWPNMFAVSGISLACKRVLELDAACAHRQINWALAAFAGRFDKEGAPLPTAITAEQRRDKLNSTNTTKVLADESDRIEALLTESVLLATDGTASWVGVRPVGITSRLQLSTLDASLYDGLAGIALFLAMRLERSCDPATRLILQNTLRGIGARLDSSPPRLGYGTGIGGIAHVLAYIQARCNEPLARVMLEHLIAKPWVLPEQISVANYDLLDGVSGVVAGLSQAWQWAREPRLLSTAVHYGNHLAEHFEDLFALLHDTHGSSVAHGTDGLRIALLRLAQALSANGNTREVTLFKELAARAKERVDIRAPRRGAGSWCHGYAGWLATRGSDTDLARRLNACADTHPAQLCCGELGRIDALLEVDAAGTHTHVLQVRLTDLILRSAADGGYRFYLQAPQTLLPGLFTGLTGIGYLCERLLRPAPSHQLPSVSAVR